MSYGFLMIHLSFTGYHNCHIYMQVHGSGVDYVFDRAVFQLVPNNAQWKTDAQARIERLRKAPITIRCVVIRVLLFIYLFIHLFIYLFIYLYNFYRGDTIS